MANNTNKTNNTLLWITVGIFTASGILLGASFLNMNCLFGGIGLLLVSFIILAISLAFRKGNRRKYPSCSLHSLSCQNSCINCLRGTLCPHALLASNELHQMRSILEGTNTVSCYIQEGPNGPYCYFPVSNASGTSLQHMETLIHKLFTDYNRLRSRASLLSNTRLNVIEADKAILQQASLKVGNWRNGTSLPAADEIRTITRRLDRINQHFEEYRRQLERSSQENTTQVSDESIIHPGTSLVVPILHSFPCNRNSPGSSTNEESNSESPFPIYLSCIVQPPPYQEIDPLQSGDLSASYAADTPPYLPCHHSGSQYSLAPPEVDSNAPPAYEESVAYAESVPNEESAAYRE